MLEPDGQVEDDLGPIFSIEGVLRKSSVNKSKPAKESLGKGQTHVMHIRRDVGTWIDSTNLTGGDVEAILYTIFCENDPQLQQPVSCTSSYIWHMKLLALNLAILGVSRFQ